MSDDKYLTRKEAAELCRLSKDTIRRAERAGKLPSHRKDECGVVQIPTSDLVAAGLLSLQTDTEVQRPIYAADATLSGSETRVAVLEAQIERMESEVEFLRNLLAGEFKAVA